MLFASAEDALEFPLGRSLCGALLSGLIFAVFVLLLAAIRELFGAASLCGNPIEALAPYKITLLTKTTGGLFVFAILLAVVYIGVKNPQLFNIYGVTAGLILFMIGLLYDALTRKEG